MIEHVKLWVESHPLSPVHVDCATTVMLKILDGKCKMNSDEKVVMALLYEQVKHCPSQLLGADIHAFIADSRDHLDDATKMLIYEQRLLAETRLSRPVMKGFKALIREQGLFKEHA
jgi:hypothetical protein